MGVGVAIGVDDVGVGVGVVFGWLHPSGMSVGVTAHIQKIDYATPSQNIVIV